MTVEAGLSGFDIDITLLDQTAPGLMIMATQTQAGNNNCVVNNLNIDIDNQKVSLEYIDSVNEEGNLPWFKSIQLCEQGADGLCFYQNNLISSTHTYLEGTIFEHTFENIPSVDDGTYVLKIGFADGEFQGYQIQQDINILNGLIDDGSGCLLGDANGDNILNWELKIGIVYLKKLVLKTLLWQKIHQALKKMKILVWRIFVTQ